MGVDHGRLHALVSEVLLHLADIHAAHEQVLGKAGNTSYGVHQPYAWFSNTIQRHASQPLVNYA